ncbi:MAG: ribonuclease HII, partial [Oscillospiraceae bacterium]|nr:ribonuclease HII [Oscillospiraceae bacterium]
MNLYEFDSQYNGLVCGIDEAGRGCLAGDVFAAAVILDEENPIQGLNDSKKLTVAKRESLYEQIVKNSKAYAISTASVAEIEELNILKAALLAMKRAHEQVEKIITPDYILVDGNQKPPIIVNCQLSIVNCIVSGDGKSAAIAAASILAKVARGRHALQLGREETHQRFSGKKKERGGKEKR